MWGRRREGLHRRLGRESSSCGRQSLETTLLIFYIIITVELEVSTELKDPLCEELYRYEVGDSPGPKELKI